MADLELKKIQDDLQSVASQFREANDALIAEKASRAAESAEQKQLVDRLNGRLDEIEIKSQRARVASGVARIDDEIRGEHEHRAPEQKAFSKWARRGHTRLNGDEVKSLTALKYLDREEGEYKALETDSDVEGGVFVPHQLANRVIQKLILVSPFRSVASVETISSNALEIPAEGATNFSAGWVGERGSRTTSTTASLRMERVPVHEMYAEPPVSQTQLDDSVFDIEMWLSSRISTIMAQIEGLAFIKGTGVTQPEGVAANSNIPAGQQLTIANGTFSANTTAQGADQLISMWATLPTYYANEGTWLLNRATLGVIRKFKDTNSQYVWAPGGFGDGVRTGFPATIMGQPYVEMPDMDSIGANKYPVMFGNWRSAYQIVDRLGMRVIRDNLTQKPFVLFYTTKRVGGQVVLGEAIVQLKTT
jgi:HK97 family phage major capsid protein